MFNQIIKENALRKINLVKNKHTKVLHLEHKFMKMKRYLVANRKLKLKNEEVQLIFKLRNRVTETKMNFQGKYDFYECDACGKEDESQKHILECAELMKHNKNESDNPPYERLFDGTVMEQSKIAKLFRQNMDIKEKMYKK